MQYDNFDNSIPTLGYFNNRSDSATWCIEHSQIDFIDLTYIINGQATYTINGQKITVGEGDLLCIPKGSDRYAVCESPKDFECYAANFQLNLPTGEETTLPLPLLSKPGLNGDIISLYRRLNETWLSRSPGYVMRARANLMLILQRFFAILVYDVDTYQYDPRVRKAMRFITEHYADPLTISTVADKVLLNSVYFGALFKKETRYSFRDYLNTVRLNQAEDMLRTGRWNVSEVAQNCGFADVFYFSRMFKKYKGIPPSAINPNE